MIEMVWAIVPVKPFRQAKSRLAAVLTGEQRVELGRAFLSHTLGVLAQVPAVVQTLVVSRDPAALAAARSFGARTVVENGRLGLNEALQRATLVAIAGQASAVLIVPTDLPLLEPGEVQQLLQQGRHGPCIVIAPDRHEQGTNVLLVRPPGGLAYAFGAGSFYRHQALARQAGAGVHVCRLAGAALDVDVAEDWTLYEAARKAGAARLAD